MAPAKKSAANTKRETLIHNERVKLRATWINGTSIALIAVGGFAPIVSAMYGDKPVDASLAWGSAICFLVATTLHYLARRVLRGLQ